MCFYWSFRRDGVVAPTVPITGRSDQSQELIGVAPHATGIRGNPPPPISHSTKNRSDRPIIKRDRPDPVVHAGWTSIIKTIQPHSAAVGANGAPQKRAMAGARVCPRGLPRTGGLPPIFLAHIEEFCSVEILDGICKNALLGLRQSLPSPPHACGIPRFAIALYYPLSGNAPDTGNTKSIACAPCPPQGDALARRGRLVQI